MRDASAIVVLALVAGAAALESGLPASQPAICPPPITTVQYLPVPEPSVVSPAINIALPPMTLSLYSSEAKDDAKQEEATDDEPVRAHHRRRHRWRRR